MSATDHTYGGRYAVIEQVGSGGMAYVYRARDELLGREVAVKVLSERFAGDKSFVERFRREAQAAANLSHPNIVSLYDYGAEGNTYFIVMEFIEGRSLAEIIQDEGPLLPERAAEIAADVAKALERAHSAGLVHRDIKPGNIMITDTGQTKVTDFGIVRALGGEAEKTMTQTGMVIGTAAYLSPEQAQGNPVDARSDVYSLGCVLFEMLTGNPPFSGETPLSIAYKHVREDAPPPSSLNPDAPPALDAITLKALAKNPENRYGDAAEMHEDLQRFLAGQKVHATPLMSDATMVAPAATGTSVMRQVEYDEPPEGRRPAFYVLIALLILGLFALLAWFLASNVLNPGKAKVPDLIGLDVDEATQKLEDRGLEAEIQNKQSRKPEGEVLEQDPAAGKTLDEGKSVTLVVSAGPRQVDVPDVVGMTLEEASAEIADAKLKVGRVEEEVSDEIPEGEVIDQSPVAETSVDAGSKVNLTVSSGPEAVTVPDVVGMTEEEAVATIQDAGLDVQINRGPSNDYEEGIVASQDPGAGAEAAAGDTVVILVSEGPEEQEMPDVTGRNGDEAEAFLEDDPYNLVVTQQDADPSQCGAVPPGTVCAQSPASGEPVSPGDSATLYVQPGDAALPGNGAFAWASVFSLFLFFA